MQNCTNPYLETLLTLILPTLNQSCEWVFSQIPSILGWRWVPGTLHWKGLEGVWAQQETVFSLIRDFVHGQKRLDWHLESQLFALGGLNDTYAIL